jgi:hypothetical protein
MTGGRLGSGKQGARGAAAPAPMSPPGREARRAWSAWADWRGHGRCDACGGMAYLGRARRNGRRLCVTCWPDQPEARHYRKRLGR